MCDCDHDAIRDPDIIGAFFAELVEAPSHWTSATRRSSYEVSGRSVMPHFLRFNRFRMAVAAYLANRSTIDFTECLQVVDSHWLDVRTAWELGDRFQDCGYLLASAARKLVRRSMPAPTPCQLDLPFAPLQQRLPLSHPLALTPYTLARS